MQGSRLYVGNLSYSATEEEIAELFSNYGEVKSVNIIGRKGFGFVEMSTPAEAQKAKDTLDSTEFKGRVIKVDEARPPRERGDRDRQPRREFRDRRRY